MEKMKIFQKEPDSNLRVRNNIQFKQKTKAKESVVEENMDTTEFLQGLSVDFKSSAVSNQSLLTSISQPSSTSQVVSFKNPCRLRTDNIENSSYPSKTVVEEHDTNEFENPYKTEHLCTKQNLGKESCRCPVLHDSIDVQNKSPRTETRTVFTSASSAITCSTQPDFSEGSMSASSNHNRNVNTERQIWKPQHSISGSEENVTHQTFKKVNSNINHDPKIVLLKFLQDNVWMIHDIIEQQIMLMYKQAEIMSLTFGHPMPSIEEIVSIPNNFTLEQQEAFERLVVRFDSTLPNRRRNLQLFVNDHSWVLEAEIERHQNCINTVDYDLESDQTLQSDIAVLMTSVFGKMNLGSHEH